MVALENMVASGEASGLSSSFTTILFHEYKFGWCGATLGIFAAGVPIFIHL